MHSETVQDGAQPEKDAAKDARLLRAQPSNEARVDQSGQGDERDRSRADERQLRVAGELGLRQPSLHNAPGVRQPPKEETFGKERYGHSVKLPDRIIGITQQNSSGGGDGDSIPDGTAGQDDDPPVGPIWKIIRRWSSGRQVRKW